MPSSPSTVSRWLAATFAVVILVNAGSVSAEDTIVLPTEAPSKLSSLATTVNESIVSVASKLPGKTTLGSISLEDLAVVTGCSPETVSCRKAILATIRAKRILVATISSSSIQISLLTANGSTSKQNVPIAATNNETTDAVKAVTRKLLGIKPAAATRQTPREIIETNTVVGRNQQSTKISAVRPQDTRNLEAESPLIPNQNTDRQPAFSLGKVRPTTWVVIGGGVLALTTGIVFHNLAGSKQQEADSAPTRTVADVRALVELENSVKQRSTLGFVFTGIGVAAIVGGGVLAVRDGRRRSETTIAVSLLRSGGVIVGIGGWL